MADVEMTTEELVKWMSDKIHKAYTAYHVWKWLEQARNLNIGKETAENNIKIMNRQHNFFHVALEGSFDVFVLNLSVFFDKERSLSLKRLLKQITISEENRKKIDEILDKHKNTIDRIKDKIRDKDVAHFDTDVDRAQPNMLIYKDVEDLFTGVHEIFNILSNSFNQALWVFDHMEDQVINDMEYLFKNLDLGEAKRIEDINKKWDTPQKINPPQSK